MTAGSAPAIRRRSWAVPGATAVSPTGMAHLVAEADSGGWFTTACGVQVALWQAWGRAIRRREYPHCGRCSIFGGVS